jgi:hypothetical protein
MRATTLPLLVRSSRDTQRLRAARVAPFGQKGPQTRSAARNLCRPKSSARDGTSWSPPRQRDDRRRPHSTAALSPARWRICGDAEDESARWHWSPRNRTAALDDRRFAPRVARPLYRPGGCQPSPPEQRCISIGRGAGTRRRARCVPAARDRATGTCPIASRGRARRPNRCGRRRRPGTRRRSCRGPRA